jgi:hypothetical protein
MSKDVMANEELVFTSHDEEFYEEKE